jgi:hypothetical protein
MRPTSIKPPGEPVVEVIHDDVGNTTTYSNGSSSLKIYRYTSGVLEGLISQDVANEGTSSEEAIYYTYTETSPSWRRLSKPLRPRRNHHVPMNRTHPMGGW